MKTKWRSGIINAAAALGGKSMLYDATGENYNIAGLADGDFPLGLLDADGFIIVQDRAEFMNRTRPISTSPDYVSGDQP